MLTGLPHVTLTYFIDTGCTNYKGFSTPKEYFNEQTNFMFISSFTKLYYSVGFFSEYQHAPDLSNTHEPHKHYFRVGNLTAM